MFLSVFHISITSSYLLPEIAMRWNFSIGKSQCPHSPSAVVEIIYKSRLTPPCSCPAPSPSQYPAWNQLIPYFDVKKKNKTFFIKIDHGTCNWLCRVIASPGGYWQPSLSLVSDELRRSFGNQSLHPGRFPRLAGLRLTCCTVLTWGRIPLKLKSPGN